MRRRAGDSVLPAVARRDAGVSRGLRVAAQLREDLALALHGLEDPRLAAAGVTRVEITDDLKLARIYVRIAYGPDDAEARARLMRALRAACARLRRQAGRALGLRYTPELRFLYDKGQDAADRVEALLAEIRGEQKPR